MMEASRAYEANSTMIQSAKTMFGSAFKYNKILKLKGVFYE